MPDNSTEIAKLEAILDAGASAMTTDGQSVTWDLDKVEKRLRELRSSDNTYSGTRPVATQIDLSGF